MSEDQPVSGRRRLVRPLTERKLGSGAEREGVVDALRAQGVVRPERRGALVGPNGGAPSFKVLGEPMLIPSVGQYVSFFDTEGKRVSMLQPYPRD